MYGRLDNDNFNSLRILIDSGESSSIILGKHMQKVQKKMINPICWSTQVGDFNNDYTSELEFLLPELDMKKGVM